MFHLFYSGTLRRLQLGPDRQAETRETAREAPCSTLESAGFVRGATYRAHGARVVKLTF